MIADSLFMRAKQGIKKVHPENGYILPQITDSHGYWDKSVIKEKICENLCDLRDNTLKQRAEDFDYGFV